MMKTVPPLNDLFNMAGLNLPNYLAKANETSQDTPTEEVPSEGKKNKK